MSTVGRRHEISGRSPHAWYSRDDDRSRATEICLVAAPIRCHAGEHTSARCYLRRRLISHHFPPSARSTAVTKVPRNGFALRRKSIAFFSLSVGWREKTGVAACHSARRRRHVSRSFPSVAPQSLTPFLFGSRRALRQVAGSLASIGGFLRCLHVTDILVAPSLCRLFDFRRRYRRRATSVCAAGVAVSRRRRRRQRHVYQSLDVAQAPCATSPPPRRRPP